MSGNKPPTARPSPSERPTAPRVVLDRYRLVRRLGAGAFGTVWMARDERLDREVAVKILPRERVMGGRFEREARAAARLAHPGIVTLYEATVDEDAAYLVSELVRGATLQQLLEAGRLSDRGILGIAISLCDALSHAHAESVVHRDVKPSNILVPERPSSPAHPAKLTDFGVARVIGGDSLTRTRDVVGTAAYMAPEQAEGRETGATADLYSLALVTYEALSGVNPVRGGTAATRARRLGAYLPPLRRQRRDLPRELGRAIDLALRPRPRERGTLDELRESLEISVAQVAYTPGIVAVPWRPGSIGPRRPDPPQDDESVTRPDARGRVRDRHAEGPNDADAHAPGGDPGVQAAGDARDWPARAIAATAAAATAAWVSAHLLAATPGRPAVVAILAWVLVAALPRIGWLALTVALAAAAALQHRPGGALLMLIAALIPVLLLPRGGTSWPLPATATALGLIALAGAWPALAARITTGAWRRAALAATGWLWLVLAASLTGADLYTRRPPGTPAPDVWTASFSITFGGVIKPLATTGLFAPAVVWAVAAVVLPWVLRGRSLPRDIVLVTVWAAATVAATDTVIVISSGSDAVTAPPTAVVGAIAGGVLALLPTARRTWRESRSRANAGPELP